MSYFVTAIHTDSGKTLVCAVICEALGADYWKPVQAGRPYDSEMIRTLVDNKKTRIHAERHILKTPASPHAAAEIEGVTISLDDFVLPVSTRPVIVEGAGGCLVPLNRTDFVVDLIRKLDLSVILVSNYYLGSINHTLLTVESLQQRQIRIEGIIFNGDRNEHSRDIILHHSKLKCLLEIDLETRVNPLLVKKYAKQLNENWIR